MGIYSTKLVFDVSFGGPENVTLTCNLQYESPFLHGKRVKKTALSLAKPRSAVNSHTNGWSAQLVFLRKSLKTHGKILTVYLV